MSTELKQRLEQILSLETAPARSLTPEQRDALETIFGGVDDELALNALLQVAVAAFTHYGGNLRARYAMALAREAAGDDEDAGLGFHELARELGQREDWTGARDLAVHALSLRPDHKTIRLLLEIWDHLEDKTEMEQDLELAHSLNPEAPDLLWLDAQRAAEEGLVEQEETFACQALNEFVREKEGDRAEEPLLRVLDSTSPRVFRDLLKILPRMAAAGLEDLMNTTLELAGSKFEAHGLEGDLAKALEAILLKHKDLARLRPAYGRALLMSQGGDAGVAAFIHDCGLDNPEIPLEDALARFREMYDLRPGAYVQHHNFGVGRITAHDGEFLIIDFEEKQGHRMALEIARRSLRPLPDGCLRVARFRDPEGMANEIANDPASLLVRALTELGGEATARDLRECLAGTTVPEGEWTSWWKKARDAAAKDDRVDTSQAYRQVYRLPGVASEDEELELPALPVKSGPRAVITLVERLLKQHPELEDRVRRQYCDDLVERVQNVDSRGDALAAVPTLLRWLPDRKDQWLEIARHGLQREPGVAAGVNAEQQKQLLAFGLDSDVWQEAALSALASRFPAIRDTALNALHERLGDEFASRMQEVLVSRYPLPNTQLALVRMGLAGTLNGDVFSAWDMLEGLVRVLGGNPPQKLRMAALELLDPQEELGKLYFARCGWIRRNGIPGWGGWFTNRDLAGGGPLIDLAVHMLDLTMWLMGNPEPVTVLASTYSVFGPKMEALGPWGTPNLKGKFNVEDMAVAMIKFAGGQTISLEASWASRCKREWVYSTLMGDKAGASLERVFGFDGVDDTSIDTLELYTQENGVPVNRELIVQPDPAMGRHSAVSHFVDCLLDDSVEMISPATDGLRIMKILDAAYKSAETGKAVNIK